MLPRAAAVRVLNSHQSLSTFEDQSWKGIIKTQDILTWNAISRFLLSTRKKKMQLPRCWELDHKEDWSSKNWCFWTVVLEKTLESPLDYKEIKLVNPKGNQSLSIQRKSILNIHWKDWCWSWSFSTLDTWCQELTHWKRPWCWERLKAGGEGDDRGWHDWMASSTQWTCAWASSGRWWRTGKSSVLQSMGLQRVRCNWVTEQQPKCTLLRCQSSTGYNWPHDIVKR